MKKLGCSKCGGQKMQKGGTMKTTVGKATPKGQIYGIPQTGPTGPNYQGVNTMKKGGMVKTVKKITKKVMQNGGSLKPVSTDQKGLAKLPTAVRNKMGYQRNGGLVKKK